MTRLLAVAAALLLCGAGYPRVGKYCAAGTDGRPFVLPGGGLDSTLCRLLARYDHVIIDGGPLARYPQFPRYLRALNPNIRLIGYFNASVTGDWGGYAQNEYQAIVQTGGLLYCYDASHSPHVCYDWFNIDLGQVSTQAAHADTISNIARRAGVDAVFLDVWPVNMKGTTSLSARDTIDWQRMGYTSLSDFWSNWNAGSWVLGARIREGTDLPVIGNYGPFGFRDICAGWMRENFPYQNGGTWESNMVVYRTPAWADSGYLSDARHYQSPQQSWLIWTPSSDPATDRRIARFTLGSATLGNGVASNWRAEWNAFEANLKWYPELSVRDGRATMDATAKGWMGAALGPYRKLASGIYMREFERGLVLVNPTYGSLSYYGPETMYSLAAPFPEYRPRASRSFVVPARDGLFLWRPR